MTSRWNYLIFYFYSLIKRIICSKIKRIRLLLELSLKLYFVLYLTSRERYFDVIPYLYDCYNDFQFRKIDHFYKVWKDIARNYFKNQYRQRIWFFYNFYLFKKYFPMEKRNIRRSVLRTISKLCRLTQRDFKRHVLLNTLHHFWATSSQTAVKQGWVEHELARCFFIMLALFLM